MPKEKKMAKRVLHSRSIQRLFPKVFGTDFKDLILIKKGSTSSVYQHPLFSTMIIGFTTDKAKINWFKENQRRLNFKLVEVKMEGSPYDEIHKYLYCFTMKKLEPLSLEETKFIQNELLSPFNKLKLHQTKKSFSNSLKLFYLAKKTTNKKIKDMLFRLKSFVDNNAVEMELIKSSFLKLPTGEIMLIDPVYSTKERI
jgi:hypothetical protein